MAKPITTKTKHTCNACWNDLQNERMFVTTCEHVFCSEDARKYFSKDLVCPVCDTPLGTRGITEVTHTPARDMAVRMYGLQLSDVMQLTSMVVNFHTKQKDLELEKEVHLSKMNGRTMKHQQQQNERTIRSLRAELESLRGENSRVKEYSAQRDADIQSLQEKYTKKSRQSRHLIELLDNEKAKNRRNSAVAGRSPRNAPSLISPRAPSRHGSTPVMTHTHPQVHPQQSPFRGSRENSQNNANSSSRRTQHGMASSPMTSQPHKSSSARMFSTPRDRFAQARERPATLSSRGHGRHTGGSNMHDDSDPSDGGRSRSNSNASMHGHTNNFMQSRSRSNSFSNTGTPAQQMSMFQNLSRPQTPAFQWGQKTV